MLVYGMVDVCRGVVNVEFFGEKSLTLISFNHLQYDIYVYTENGNH